MMSFDALKYFESVIKKLKKIIALYQPCDLHLCYRCLFNGFLSTDQSKKHIDFYVP